MLAGTHWQPLEFFVADDDVLGDADVDYTPVDSERLAELCGSREHQGAAARMPAYPYGRIDELVASSPKRLIVLDRVQYANNFGTILRSAEVFGFEGCLVTGRGQCEVTAAIARMSAGAIFQVPVTQADDLPAAIASLAEAGVTCLSTDPETGTACDAAKLAEPVAIVIGAEHDGVRPETAAACSGTLQIPQLGRTQSLNASSSAAVLMYEVSRQMRGRA